MNRTNRNTLLIYFLLFLIFFSGAYLYFAESQTRIIYGDDLSVYQLQAGSKKLSEVIDVGRICTKYRPIHGVITYLLVNLFRKNLFYYFLFNVFVQALIGVVFTATVNVFLRNMFLSFMMGLFAAFTRFGYYNVIQVLCGGPMEGVAMLFFLLTLYHLTVYLARNEFEQKRLLYHLVMSVLFANLAVYTHERYIVLFPAIILCCIIGAVRNDVKRGQTVIVCAVALGSLLLNYALKVYVYQYPFLVGTRTSSIVTDFAWSRQLGYLKDALASIIQFNSGAEYLIGVAFHQLPGGHKVLVCAAAIAICIILVWAIVTRRNTNVTRSDRSYAGLRILAGLSVLFGATLAPAISTVNLEQRWLQAPFCVFILIVVVIFNRINTKDSRLKTGLLLFFAAVFLSSDRIYTKVMDTKFWMKSAEFRMSTFVNAAANGTIRREAKNLFILEDTKSSDYEIPLSWGLANGYFFDFYQDQGKTIIYLDSRRFTDPAQLQYMVSFDPATDEVIQPDSYVKDITADILKERDQYFAAHGIVVNHL
jgi:hypothetical protein